MNLKKYIELVGDSAAAEMFGITTRAAMSYRLGDRKPRPAVAERIVTKTKGKVSWKEIYTEEADANAS